MDRLLYINTVPDIRIREMVSSFNSDISPENILKAILSFGNDEILEVSFPLDNPQELIEAEGLNTITLQFPNTSLLFNVTEINHTSGMVVLSSTKKDGKNCYYFCGCGAEKVGYTEWNINLTLGYVESEEDNIEDVDLNSAQLIMRIHKDTTYR